MDSEMDMTDAHMDTTTDPNNNNNNNDDNNDDDEIDETPVFVKEGDAVEVTVDDTNVPMEDDDDDDNDNDNNNDETIVDMATAVIATHTDPVYALAVSSTSSGGLRVVTGGGDDRAVWHEISSNGHIQSTSLESLYHYKDSISVVKSNAPYIHFDTTQPPNPDWMAVGGLDGSIVLFGDGGRRVQPLEGPSADIEFMKWHPKGGNVLLAGSSDCTIWMFHTDLNKCLQVFVGHEDAVTCGTFSADGKVALSGSADGTLRIWAPKTGKSKHVFRFYSNSGTVLPSLTCLATHGGTDQQLIMAGAEDGQAHICHVANKKHITSLRHFDPASQPQQQQQQQGEVMLPSGVEAVGFCKINPHWCATGGMDGVLKIWDLSNQGQCRHTCTLNETTKAGITQLTWHPTVPLVVTSTTRGQVHVWDARNGQLLQTLTGHADVINDMDVSFVPGSGVAGRAVIVTASDDKTVRIFNVDMDAAIAQAAQQQHQ